jgi:hypothetical protein
MYTNTTVFTSVIIVVVSFYFYKDVRAHNLSSVGSDTVGAGHLGDKVPPLGMMSAIETFLSPTRSLHSGIAVALPQWLSWSLKIFMQLSIPHFLLQLKEEQILHLIGRTKHLCS